jgi:hypothetical protein
MHPTVEQAYGEAYLPVAEGFMAGLTRLIEIAQRNPGLVVRVLNEGAYCLEPPKDIERFAVEPVELYLELLDEVLLGMEAYARVPPALVEGIQRLRDHRVKVVARLRRYHARNP